MGGVLYRVVAVVTVRGLGCRWRMARVRLGFPARRGRTVRPTHGV